MKFLDEGGFVMYFILAESLLALGFIIERSYTYYTLRTHPADFLERLGELNKRSDPRPALEYCGQSKALVAEFAADLLKNFHHGPATLRKLAASKIDLDYKPRLEKRLDVLSMIVKTAPMLGLFGTVLGMIGAFDKMSGAEQPNANDLAGNIKIALYTTFFGLAVAIPVIAAMTYLRSWRQRLEVDLERCSEFIQDLTAHGGGTA